MIKHRRKHIGRWISAVLIIVALALLVAGASHGSIEWDKIPGIAVQSIILEGLLNTIVLAICSMALGLVLGLIVSLLRVSHNPVAVTVSWIWIWVFRALPTLLQVMLWYNLALVFPRFVLGIPGTGITFVDMPTNQVLTAFSASMLGLGLNESAYMAEIIRSGLNSVGKDQREAAESIGMPPSMVVRRVILPQAIRVILPPIGNDFIGVLKATSICSTIGYLELIHAESNLSSRTLLVMESLFAASIWYLLLVSAASLLQWFVERHFNPSKEQTGVLSFIGEQLTGLPIRRSSV